MDMVIQQKLDALKNVVANTPLAKINLKYKGKETCVYAKLEYFNFSGSIKDRMAYYILRNAYEKGDIKGAITHYQNAMVLSSNPMWTSISPPCLTAPTPISAAVPWVD